MSDAKACEMNSTSSAVIMPGGAIHEGFVATSLFRLERPFFIRSYLMKKFCDCHYHLTNTHNYNEISYSNIQSFSGNGFISNSLTFALAFLIS